ncbi:MAG: Gfo/Idh/MocA family oxidoreductase [Roseiflexaceae bacterium]|nr:Gfo/Idh/MocA family oxidoreductase [Roseiflexaceae bacterium]
MHTKYGVGIIGAGRVCSEYVKAFRDHPLTTIVGIYDSVPGKAAAVLQQNGVAAQAYDSLDMLFDDQRSQIIVSATHGHLRATDCVRAAQTGRHVIIEKPAGLTPHETAQIRRAVADAGVKSIVPFVLRWNPQFLTVRQLIADGILGDLIYGEADYWHPITPTKIPGYRAYVSHEQGRSAFLAAGCHAADILRYLAGEVAEVAAFAAGPKRDLAWAYPPVIVASVKFTGGAVGKLSTILDADTPYIFNCQLLGTAGTIRNNKVYSSKHYPGALDYWTIPTIQPDSGDVAHHPFVPMIAHFLECIERNQESHASIYDTYRSMAVCYAIDESAAKGGQAVSVPND